MTSPAAARALFDRESHAVLSTRHAGLDGWPFGSVVPYAVLPNGDAVVFLSDIAEHTRNLLQDPRGCLLVADPAAAARPQAGARVAVLGRAQRRDGAAVQAAEAAYFARFPAAAAMREAHGFAAWVLEVDQVRWIAGFGAMGWLDRAAWSGEPDPLAAQAAGITAHLNEDHAAALVELVHDRTDLVVVRAEATGCDRGGLAVAATDASGDVHAVRLPFPAAVASAGDVRQSLVAMLARARAGHPRR